MTRLELTVGGRTYQVVIDDLDATPIIVRVDGEEFEVTRPPATAPAASQAPSPKSPVVSAVRQTNRKPGSTAGNTIVAPMPGTMLEVKVRAGDQIAEGDEIGILEAMKMKSSLRAERGGTVAEVRVAAGQSVSHGDVLVVFA